MVSLASLPTKMLFLSFRDGQDFFDSHMDHILGSTLVAAAAANRIYNSKMPLDKGMDHNFVLLPPDETALLFVRTAKVMKLLRQYAANTNALNPTRSTSLHIPDLVPLFHKFLFNSGATINAQDIREFVLICTRLSLTGDGSTAGGRI